MQVGPAPVPAELPPPDPDPSPCQAHFFHRRAPDEDFFRQPAAGGPTPDAEVGIWSQGSDGQHIHRDYPNNTLVRPPLLVLSCPSCPAAWVVRTQDGGVRAEGCVGLVQVMPPPFGEAPEVVECLLYHADVEEVHGPTCIVPRRPGGDDDAYDSCALSHSHLARSAFSACVEAVWPSCADDWHMHHHGSRYPHSWASDKNRVEEFWEENEPRQAAFRAQLYEREGMVRLFQSFGCAWLRRDVSRRVFWCAGVLQAWDGAALPRRHLASRW